MLTATRGKKYNFLSKHNFSIQAKQKTSPFSAHKINKRIQVSSAAY